MIKEFLKEIPEFNFIDVGSGGHLDSKWSVISPYINLMAFDPNKEECLRMESLPNNFKRVKYLPYAIAGESKENFLYKTSSIQCYSLLKPNQQWLKRFSFHKLFDVVGEEKLKTFTLDSISELQHVDVDVLKTDTQGLELPILKHALDILDRAFYVETETGFIENYIGETTFSQIDDFMRSKGFLLFDINTSHRIARDNQFKEINTGAEQLMWCEAVWLRDYVSLSNSGELNNINFSRNKALRALVLCGLQGCIDYGYEIAILANSLGYLSQSELTALQSRNAWLLSEPVNQQMTPSVNKPINYLLRLLPTKLRQTIKEEADRAIHQRHLFRF